MQPPALLVGAAVLSGLVDFGLGAETDCGSQGRVEVVLQPYEVICDGSTSTSTSTRTRTVPPSPPGGGPGTVTVVTGCSPGSPCVGTTLPPPVGCVDCTATVITTGVPSGTEPPSVTRTVTVGCDEDDESCKATTLPPPQGCTESCTVTVITTLTPPNPPASGTPPDVTRTVVGICTQQEPCLPATQLPPPDCTKPCTTIITTYPGPTPTPTDFVTTVEGSCTSTTSCAPITVPPPSDCTRPCTTTITTFPPPPDAIVTVEGSCTATTSCAPVTVPPPSGCERPCTTTITTFPPPTDSPTTTLPPDGVTTVTGTCSVATGCEPVTVPPASDCTRPCTTTITTFPPPTDSTSVPTTTLPPDGVITVTALCTVATGCEAVTVPPASDCTRPCTSTVTTYSTPPPDGVTTVTALCTVATGCEAVTVPPASDCTRPCTSTVTTYSTPPPDGVTTVTGICTVATGCEAVTVPPASDCTRPCTTTVSTFSTPEPTPTLPPDAGCEPEAVCGIQSGTGLTVKYFRNARGVGYGNYTEYQGVPNFDGVTPLDQTITSDLFEPFSGDPTRDVAGMTVNGQNFTIEYTGFFQPTVSGVWTFCQAADDISNLFIDSGDDADCLGGGPADDQTAISQPSLNTRVCGTKTLLAGYLYPVRIVWGQIQGLSALNVTFQAPGGAPRSQLPGSLYPAGTECLGG